MSQPIDHAWFVSARADPLLDDGIRRQRVYPSIPPAGQGPLHHDSMPKRICVYLGGNLGRERRYVDEAQALGRQMAHDGVGLVYGGSCVGLMGVLADAVLDAGGEVIGVVPRQLSYQELAHDSLTELHEVVTMHERKHKMQELSQGCIALPGGFGTLEEIFEALTWSQKPVEIHDKPCVFADIDGYYDHLFRFLDNAAQRGLLLPENRALARRTGSAVEALGEVQRIWAAAAADIDRSDQNVRCGLSSPPRPTTQRCGAGLDVPISSAQKPARLTPVAPRRSTRPTAWNRTTLATQYLLDHSARARGAQDPCVCP